MTKYKGSLELNWINKNKSLLYEIDDENSLGIKPVWVEKDDICVSEPRILKLNKEYGDPENENMLIKGDNLLALRSLVEEFKDKEEKDKVKCIYIDPPFNTGSAFEHYDDNLEHSQWLTMMRDRLFYLKQLLREDGFIFVHLDDKESAYCKLLLDEVFGRFNYCNEIILSTNKPFGFKSTANSLFKQANHILCYAKNKENIELNRLFIEKGYDTQYKFIFDDISKPEEEWKWDYIHNILSKELGYKDRREAIREMGENEFYNKLAIYAIEHAERVFRTASVTGGALLKRRKTIEKSHEHRDKIIRHPNDDMDYMFIGGERVLFYKERLCFIEGFLLPGELITDIWADIPLEGIAKEGGVDFPKSKKAEKLIKRILDMTTESRQDKILKMAYSLYLKDHPQSKYDEFIVDRMNQSIYLKKVKTEEIKSDLVFDSFAGSGTTAAVAHKMGRRWITIELGKHAETLCIKRFKNVINKKNPDSTGISKDDDVNWKGGGGFRYYEVGDSIIKDLDMNWDMTLEEMSRAVFMNFDYSMIKGDTHQLETGGDEFFLGKQKGGIAICLVTKGTKIIRRTELNKLVKDLSKKYPNQKVTIFTNMGVAVKPEELSDKLDVRKIPESILKKYRMV